MGVGLASLLCAVKDQLCQCIENQNAHNWSFGQDLEAPHGFHAPSRLPPGWSRVALWQGPDERDTPGALVGDAAADLVDAGGTNMGKKIERVT